MEVTCVKSPQVRRMALREPKLVDLEITKIRACGAMDGQMFVLDNSYVKEDRLAFWENNS